MREATQIDGLSGAAGEDDLVGGTCIDELAHRLASSLVGLGSHLAEEMHPTVHWHSP